MLHFEQVAILAVIQGLAELLPVSSSAHVVLAEKMMGLDPTSPEMTFLLVMLHTGTAIAVLLYFFKRWRALWSSEFLKSLIIATALTGILGYALKHLIEKALLQNGGKGEIEELFGNLVLIGGSLAAVGCLILWSARQDTSTQQARATSKIGTRQAAWIGAIQGLCLPFRGFSRSGATISTGMLAGVTRLRAEEFSFALAIILTPPVIFREVHRLMKSPEFAANASQSLGQGLLGMVLAFVAGLIALKWLSKWLEEGKWKFFGWYCLAASAFVFWYQS